MLDYIVLQMRKNNHEKGYYTENAHYSTLNSFQILKMVVYRNKSSPDYVKDLLAAIVRTKTLIGGSTAGVICKKKEKKIK